MPDQAPDYGTILLQIVALLFSVVFHEVSHGWVAEKCGDPTARMAGRITLNPLPHLDPFGSVILPLLLTFSGARFFFAYAKPVPVDTRNLRNPRIDGIKVAVVGPLSNLFLGLLFVLALAPSIVFLGQDHALSRLLTAGVVVNATLAVFNLLPVPPLDGSWILENTLRGAAYNVWHKIRPFGMVLVVGILLLPPLARILIDVPRGIVLGGYDNVLRTVMGWMT